jgi:Fe2+ transport system protein FeoA
MCQDLAGIISAVRGELLLRQRLIAGGFAPGIEIVIGALAIAVLVA